MEKELKSCTGIFLRADIIGHGHHTLFGRNRLFSYCSITLLVSHIKKLETYCALFIFLEFRTVCQSCKKSGHKYPACGSWKYLVQCPIIQISMIHWRLKYKCIVPTRTARGRRCVKAFSSNFFWAHAFLFGGVCSVLQDCRKSLKVRGAHSNVVGIICPPPCLR